MENTYAVLLKQGNEELKAKMTFPEVQAFIEKKQFMKHKESLVVHELTGNIQFDVYDSKDRNWKGSAMLIKN